MDRQLVVYIVGQVIVLSLTSLVVFRHRAAVAAWAQRWANWLLAFDALAVGWSLYLLLRH